ncbi:MAG TPA: ComF family protein [Planococcus sp. (in: firmicutes)]|nr:ComF family protein [Planococcus sp. (in: firmicutes)]
MKCYLCDGEMQSAHSWRELFFNDIQEVACVKCKEGFLGMGGPGCRICGLPGDKLCIDCVRWEETSYRGVIGSGTSLFTYNEAMKTYLHQYKFLQDVLLSEVFAKEISASLKKEQAVLIPIPMNPEKLKERTFPHVERLLDAAGLEYVQLLEKNADIQSKKTKEERLNSKPLFTHNGQRIPARVMLVDDLYTTGTTMRHAAKILKEGGARDIRIFTLIRG